MDRDLEAAEALVLLAKNGILSPPSPPPLVEPASPLLPDDISSRFMIYHNGKELVLKMLPRFRKRYAADHRISRPTKQENGFVESSFKNTVENNKQTKELDAVPEKNNINYLPEVIKHEEEDSDVDVVGLDTSEEAMIPPDLSSIWDYAPPSKKARKASNAKTPKISGKRRKKSRH